MLRSVFFPFALLFVVCDEGAAQDVVSASSGVLQYFEGAVLLDSTLVEHKTAVFPSLKNGSAIRTDKGRAELLLTPGAYLRIDENSSLRMASNSLTDTRLELTDGTAILDTLNASPADAVALIFRGSEVRFPKPGVYRMDCDLGELQVYSGNAEVTHHGVSSTVDSSHNYYFGLDLTTGKFGEGMLDEFYDWARNRSDVIADQNQIASAEQDDAQDPDPSGSAGMFPAAPLYSSPSYAGPFTSPLGYSIYGSGLDSYLYPQAQYLGFEPFPSILLVAPFRRRYGSSGWPGSAAGIRPHPPSVIAKWPAPARSILTYGPARTLSYPMGASYYRTGTPIARPAVTSVPRVTFHPSAAPHAAPPRLGAVGHR